MRRDDTPNETGFSTKLAYLLIGGGIGAILALLFAPKSSEELRTDIAASTYEGSEVGRYTYNYDYEAQSEKISNSYSTASGTAGGGRSSGHYFDSDKAASAASGLEGDPDTPFPVKS